MPLIRIWVYDHILASSVAGCIDVFAAANFLWLKRHGNGKAPPLKWRLESLDGKPVRTASGQVLNVDGLISPRSAADAVIVPGPFVADIERFFGRKDLLKPLCSALRYQHGRGTLLASYIAPAVLFLRRPACLKVALRPPTGPGPQRLRGAIRT